MWSVGESNISVFGVALGMGPALAGLLDTVPRLVGSLAQTWSTEAVRRLGSHRRWVVMTATVQALVFVPLAIGGVAGAMPFWVVFALAALYWAAAWGCGNAWTTFISTLVPRRVRPRFFARRNRWLNIVIVVSTVAGGWWLEVGREADWLLGALGVLFAISCVSRLISARYLSRHSEPVPLPPGLREVPLRELIGRYRHGAGGRLLVYRLGMELAIQTSTPFLIPFLLLERGLDGDYAMFGVVVASQILAKALALPLWGRVAHEHGPRALLRLGGLAIIPLPALWLIDDSAAWMIAVQALTGVFLGAYELACFLLVFDTIPERERTSVLSRFIVAQFGVTFAGSVLGALLLKAGLGGGSGYVAVFLSATVLRALTVLLLARVPLVIAPGDVPAEASAELPPLAGSFEQPVIPLRPGGGEPHGPAEPPSPADDSRNNRTP